MKKHLSVLMLFMRSTLYKSLLIMLIMAAVEGVLFALALNNTEGYFGLDTVLSASRPEIVFAVCFLILSVLLCLTGCEFGSRQGYTLSRLRISHRAVFVWQSIDNAGIFFLFWAAQVGIILAFCGIYTARHPQDQAAMLVFYANNFLHSLFPLEETGNLICNIALLLSLSVTSACFPILMRRGGKPIAFIAVVLICIRFFVREMAGVGTDIMLSIITIAISAYAAYGVCKEANDEQIL